MRDHEYDQEVANSMACFAAARDQGLTPAQADACEDGQHACRLCPFKPLEQRATHQVLMSYDGCTNWCITLPNSVGSLNSCLNFLAAHLPPKGFEFDLIDLRSERAISYMVQPATRRVRLTVQDLRNR